MNRGSYGAARPSSISPPFLPGGYLTLVSGSPIITADQAAKTVIYYAQDTHNAIPVVRNGERHALEFDEPQLVLTSAHLANTIYDVFAVERNGKAHLVTGPAWTTSTGGSGARGTGGGTSELTRSGGMLVNRWAALGLNASGSQGINPGEGLYLGTILVDGSNGQVSCHTDYGQSRRWAVWNYYNQKPIQMKCGDATSSWLYATASWRIARADASNFLNVLRGIDGVRVDLSYDVYMAYGSATAGGSNIAAIGVDSTGAASGRSAVFATSSAGALTVEASLTATHNLVSGLGLNAINALEFGNTSRGITFSGGAPNMNLRAKWLG